MQYCNIFHVNISLIHLWLLQCFLIIMRKPPPALQKYYIRIQIGYEYRIRMEMSNISIIIPWLLTGWHKGIRRYYLCFCMCFFRSLSGTRGCSWWLNKNVSQFKGHMTHSHQNVSRAWTRLGITCCRGVSTKAVAVGGVSAVSLAVVGPSLSGFWNLELSDFWK